MLSSQWISSHAWMAACRAQLKHSLVERLPRPPRAGETALQLKALAALAADTALIDSQYLHGRQLTVIHNSSSRGSHALF